MQYFYIVQNSDLPYLRMELVNDGKFEFMKSGKFFNAIQNADVTFSMWDEDDVLKISEEPCVILLSEEGCEARYVIEYRWRKKNTKTKGKFRGQFKIDFKGDLMQEGVEYPEGVLLMPIYEDVIVMVK